MQLNIKKVKLHNFGSYQDATFEIESRGFCLVTGENHYKADNASSNGSGKSFWTHAICYALTGETINGLKNKLKNILVEDTEMYVELQFNFDGSDYIIKRGQDSGKFLYIMKDGTDMSGKTYTETLAKLSECLPELTKDLIGSCLILGQGMPNKFSGFSPAGRKELLERLTKSEFMINDIKKRVTDRVNEVNSQLRVLQDSSLVQKTKLDANTENTTKLLLELQNRTKPNFEEELKQQETLKTQLEEVIKTTREDIAKYQKEIDDITPKQLEAVNKKQEDLSAELAEYTSAKGSKEVEKATNEANIRTLRAEITKLKQVTDICPYCHQKMPNQQKPDTTQQEAELARLEASTKVLTENLNKLQATHLSYIQEINKEHDSVINEYNKKVQDLKVSKLSLEQKDRTDNGTLNKIVEAINKLKYDQASWDIEQARLDKTKIELETEKVSIEANINDLTKKMEKVNKRLDALKKIDSVIKRDFRGYLLSGIINELNKYAKAYSNIVFKHQNLNINLDGNNLEIDYCNKPIDNLSGGEKQRVDLILQLAIRKLLQNYCGFNTNMLVLDEITDFLDKQSCGAIMSLIEQELSTIESVFIISHHSSELSIPIDTELKIIKNEDGISSIA